MDGLRQTVRLIETDQRELTRPTGILGAPALSPWVGARAHLLARVSDSVAESTITLIHGPAQSGKSTLLAQWAEAQPGTTGVYTRIERGPESATRVWQGLAEAAGLEQTGDARSEFLAHLRDQEGAFLLLIDDAQHLRTAASLTVLQTILQANSRVRIIATSTTRDVRRLMARELDTTVTVAVAPDMLSATPGEINALLSARRVTRDDAFARRVLQSCEGAPSIGFASRLAAELSTVRGVLRMTAAVDDLLARIEADYARTLLDGLPERLHRFVALIALIPQPSRELIACLTDGTPESLADAASLENSGVGSWVLTPEGEIFVLDAAVAAEMRRTGAPALSSDETEALHAVAGTLEAQNDALGAALLAAHAECLPLLSGILTRSGATILASPVTELRRIARALPARGLSAHPVLELFSALVRFGTHTAVSEQPFAGIAQRAHRVASTVSVPERRALELVQIIALRRSGQFQQARDLSARVRSTPPQAGATDAAVSEELALQGAISEFISGDLPAALALFTDVLNDPEISDLGRMRSHGYAALICVLDGRVSRAAEHLDAAEASTAWHTHRNRVLAIPARLAHGFVALEGGDFTRVERVIRSLKMLGIHGEERPIFDALVGTHAIASGQKQAGLEATQRSEDLRRLDSRQLTALALAARADLLALDRRAHAGLTMLGAWDRESPAFAGVLGRLLLHVGRYTQALTWVDRWLAGDRLSPRVRVECLIVKAIASRRLGDGDLVQPCVRDARELSELHRLTVPWRLISHAEIVGSAGESTTSTHEWLSEIPNPDGHVLTAPDLTRRERIVLTQLASARTMPEIAEHLVVSPNTVKAQTRSIYRKLGATSRPHAIRIASELHLI
ncbi:LuxR family transcriptional regulator [Mycetocola tolaasinivorans]|nr:LuxR family transcriptional regulator [Mycetocola tolaasinivorans]